MAHLVEQVEEELRAADGERGDEQLPAARDGPREDRRALLAEPRFVRVLA